MSFLLWLVIISSFNFLKCVYFFDREENPLHRLKGSSKMTYPQKLPSLGPITQQYFVLISADTYFAFHILSGEITSSQSKFFRQQILSIFLEQLFSYLDYSLLLSPKKNLLKKVSFDYLPSFRLLKRFFLCLFGGFLHLSEYSFQNIPGNGRNTISHTATRRNRTCYSGLQRHYSLYSQSTDCPQGILK